MRQQRQQPFDEDFNGDKMVAIRMNCGSRSRVASTNCGRKAP